MHFAQLLVGEVRVDLRGGDIRVAEEFLHGAEVGAVYEEIGGEAVAEQVRVDVVGNPGLCCARGDEALDGARRDGADHLACAVEADE